MMILSLNAPAVQAIPDVERADRGGQTGQRLSGRRCASGLIVSAPSPRCRCRTRKRPSPNSPAASKSSAWSARWSTASRKRQRRTTSPITICRSTGRSGGGRRARRAVLSASAQSAAERPGNTKAIPGCSGRIWAFGGNRGACAAPDRQRPVRRASEAANGARPSRRGHARAAVAHRQSQWLDEGAGTNTRPSTASRHYFRKQFHLTTSGNFHTPSLVNAMTEMGADRMMFSVDWPFEDVGRRRRLVRRLRSAKPTGENRPRQRRQAVQVEALTAQRKR